MANAANYPFISAILDSAKGYTGALDGVLPSEDEETEKAWKNACAILDKYAPERGTDDSIEQAFIIYGQAVEWRAFKNGIRAALALRDELQEISGKPLYFDEEDFTQATRW